MSLKQELKRQEQIRLTQDQEGEQDPMTLTQNCINQSGAGWGDSWDHGPGSGIDYEETTTKTGCDAGSGWK